MTDLKINTRREAKHTGNFCLSQQPTKNNHHQNKAIYEYLKILLSCVTLSRRHIRKESPDSAGPTEKKWFLITHAIHTTHHLKQFYRLMMAPKAASSSDSLLTLQSCFKTDEKKSNGAMVLPLCKVLRLFHKGSLKHTALKTCDSQKKSF